MFRYGLKLWSTNDNYISEAVKLFHEGVYQYIELYVVPNSYVQWGGLWHKLMSEEGISFVIHAPHFGSGMNLSVKAKEQSNKVLTREAFEFADLLSSEIVIFHPGVAGEEKETVRQFKLIYDERIIVENKPYLTIDGSAVCNGFSPEQIRMIMKEGEVGFCLDIGHAICAANSLNANPYAFLSEFMKLKSKLFHLTDGEFASKTDQHRHFGEGDYDIKKILQMIPDGSMITIETEKKYPNRLDDYVADIRSIKDLIRDGH